MKESVEGMGKPFDDSAQGSRLLCRVIQGMPIPIYINKWFLNMENYGHQEGGADNYVKIMNSGKNMSTRMRFL